MGQSFSLAAIPSFEILGLYDFTRYGYERKCKTWNPNDLNVDLTGKVYIVTGANSGIGFATTKELAKRKATVWMICRNKQKGEEAMKTIEQDTGNNNLRLAVVDVSRPTDIFRFAGDYVASKQRLDGLIHNAGGTEYERSVTPDGNEISFATNVLGPFLLTECLFPVLQRSAPSRVITVTSGGMYTVRMDVENLQSDRSKYMGLAAYSRSKRALWYLTEYWANKKYANTGVTFNSMHPGWTRTPLVSNKLPSWFQSLPLRTPEQGADTLLWLAISPTVLSASGMLWFDREPTRTDMPLARTQNKPQDIEALYQYCHRFLEPEWANK